MPLSIISSPPDLAGCFNPIDFVFQCANQGSGTYRAEVRVFITNLPTVNAIGQQIANLKLAADGARKVTARLAELLKPYCKPSNIGKQIPRLGDIAPGLTIWRYRIEVLWFYNETRVTASEGVTDGLVTHGGLAYEKYYSQPNMLAHMARFGDTVGFPTVLPMERYITKEEYFAVSFAMNKAEYDNIYSEGDVTWRFTKLNPTGDVTAYSVGAYIDWCSVLCTTWLSMTRNMGWAPTDVATWKRMEVNFRNNNLHGFYVTPGIYYNFVENKSAFPLRSFLFKNSLGGYDVLTASGRQEVVVKKSSESITKITLANAIIGDSFKEEYNIQRNTEYQLNTGVLPTPDYLPAWEDLFHSDEVYLLLPTLEPAVVSPTSNRKATPVMIQKDSIDLDQDRRDIKSLSFKYTLKFEDFGPSGLLKMG